MIYVVMSAEIESSVSQWVVSQGLPQSLNLSTQYTTPKHVLL